MALSKSDIVSKMCATKPSKSRAAHSESLNDVVTALSSLLSEGNEITITNFGSFKIRLAAERQAKNPFTGEAMTVPAAKRVSFKASTEIKKALNP